MTSSAYWGAVAAFANSASSLGVSEDVALKALDGFGKAVLKAKGLRVEALRHLATVLDGHAAEFLDGLKENEIASLISKVDKANAGRAKEEPQWARARIHALASGQAQPDPMPAKATTAKERPPRKTVTRTSRKATALGAKRKVIE